MTKKELIKEIAVLNNALDSTRGAKKTARLYARLDELHKQLAAL